MHVHSRAGSWLQANIDQSSIKRQLTVCKARLFARMAGKRKREIWEGEVSEGGRRPRLPPFHLFVLLHLDGDRTRIREKPPCLPAPTLVLQRQIRRAANQRSLVKVCFTWGGGWEGLECRRRMHRDTFVHRAAVPPPTFVCLTARACFLLTGPLWRGLKRPIGYVGLAKSANRCACSALCTWFVPSRNVAAKQITPLPTIFLVHFRIFRRHVTCLLPP